MELQKKLNTRKNGHKLGRALVDENFELCESHLVLLVVDDALVVGPALHVNELAGLGRHLQKST